MVPNCLIANGARLKRHWKNKMSDIVRSLKEQGVAILVMVSIAILSVLGMIILGTFSTSLAEQSTTQSNTTITAFIAAFAIVGTFATVTMLVIVVKAVIGVVKGLGKA